MPTYLNPPDALINRVTHTTEQVVVGQRYYTWWSNRNVLDFAAPWDKGAIVTVTEEAIGDYYVSTDLSSGLNGPTHPAGGEGRRWAPVSPTPVRGKHYLVVANVEDADRLINSAVIGDVIEWTHSASLELYDEGLWIARRLSDNRTLWVRDFVEITGGAVVEEPPVPVVDDVENDEEEEEEEECETCDQTECRCVDCPQCGVSVDPEGDETVSRNLSWNPRYFHSNCASACDGCGETTANDDLYRVTDTYGEVCEDCRHYCGGDCGEYVSNDVERCSDCGSSVTGLDDYGHTHPSMWLGGPLPRDKDGHQDGFYIGFELEVSSSGGDVEHLRDWAENHLGGNALDLKEDGSVQGFEIATQPMTPEFFEKVNWQSLMDELEAHSTFDHSESREPTDHGLHVHIGRIAFDRDDIATAMFCFLLGQGDHLERIGRRNATHYCNKVRKPLATALVSRHNRTGMGNVQEQRLSRSGIYPGRDAINLTNSDTIEIRAFRSTRDVEHLKAAVRTVYLAARYIRHLRGAGFDGVHGRRSGKFVAPNALHWSAFMEWVAQVMPEAVDALADPNPVPPKQVTPEPSGTWPRRPDEAVAAFTTTFAAF